MAVAIPAHPNVGAGLGTQVTGKSLQFMQNPPFQNFELRTHCFCSTLVALLHKKRAGFVVHLLVSSRF
ncbi:hypothetical protein MC7420_3912 [Coleofasciculus chthonoplastes PCC 7420]|uniref:Uncharacterized protein n=1 Tax=Coleofasciculus chthonoplastes PCC 7420 TaxID=118168 RepID=B4VUP5_9CYAN|nr:hypothetical protein [Coleofasciculus chthonoplastes]EDX74388.1 hypothetical protein MC7420_3912 [Coleofasciculus chthonoplastes PCC 7420]